ncbi:MAG: hypothetical protein JWR07_3318 [Nevskia sp.]|nr:hypothetical protein [Nevskia sp.]
MDVRLFVLRVLYSAPNWVLLSRLLLFVAVFLAVQQLLLWRSKDLTPEQAAARARGRWVLGVVLAAWGVLTMIDYQGSAARHSHLEAAQSAPVRVTYGDAAHAPVIQVFTAPGCGPCKSLEGRLKAVIAQGYAVQYIPSSLGDNDWDAINAAMCEPDRKAGFERLFGMGFTAPAVPAPLCISGVTDNEAVLRKLAGQLVFPTVIMPDGFLVIGAPSDARLHAYLGAAAPLPAAAVGTRAGGQAL